MTRKNSKASAPASLSRWRRKLLQRMPRNGVCAEIGVWRGAFSEAILEVTKPQVLHLIDPWEFQGEFPDRMYGGSVARGQADMDRIYDSVCRRFDSFDNVRIHRGKSDQVLSQFEDDSLDWVYIDGNHYYDYVLQDLNLSIWKVKSGGYLTGDDYNWGASEGYPVKQALQDFALEKGLEQQLEILGSQFLLRVP